MPGARDVEQDEQADKLILDYGKFCERHDNQGDVTRRAWSNQQRHWMCGGGGHSEKVTSEKSPAIEKPSRPSAQVPGGTVSGALQEQNGRAPRSWRTGMFHGVKRGVEGTR